jgi:HPt (histidine-containing phosphotransfer) domain-containing protein
LEAAIRERSKQNMKVVNLKPRESGGGMTELEEFFVMDADSAIQTLNELFANMSGPEGLDYDWYTTTVHGMKSALANIDEKELSDFARTLEDAGNEQDITLIMAETPQFIDLLQQVVDGINASGGGGGEVGADDGAMNDDEMELLRDKLTALQAACGKFDVKTANATLNDLKQSVWPASVNAVLDEINLHLLHSAFKKAGESARVYLETL